LVIVGFIFSGGDELSKQMEIGTLTSKIQKSGLLLKAKQNKKILACFLRNQVIITANKWCNG
jgi:hypothetical protein